MSLINLKMIYEKGDALGLALLPLCSNHPIDLFCRSMEPFLCNGNTGMNWQSR